jgi:hypothetical protein
MWRRTSRPDGREKEGSMLDSKYRVVVDGIGSRAGDMRVSVLDDAEWQKRAADAEYRQRAGG